MSWFLSGDKAIVYPDSVIAQISMVATFPLEVVEADRRLQSPVIASLKGEQLTAALQSQHRSRSAFARRMTARSSLATSRAMSVAAYADFAANSAYCFV